VKSEGLGRVVIEDYVVLSDEEQGEEGTRQRGQHHHHPSSSSSAPLLQVRRSMATADTDILTSTETGRSAASQGKQQNDDDEEEEERKEPTSDAARTSSSSPSAGTAATIDSTLLQDRPTHQEPKTAFQDLTELLETIPLVSDQTVVTFLELRKPVDHVTALLLTAERVSVLQCAIERRLVSLTNNSILNFGSPTHANVDAGGFKHLYTMYQWIAKHPTLLLDDVALIERMMQAFTHHQDWNGIAALFGRNKLSRFPPAERLPLHALLSASRLPAAHNAAAATAACAALGAIFQWYKAQARDRAGALDQWEELCFQLETLDPLSAHKELREEPAITATSICVQENVFFCMYRDQHPQLVPLQNLLVALTQQGNLRQPFMFEATVELACIRGDTLFLEWAKANALFSPVSWARLRRVARAVPTSRKWLEGAWAS